MAGGTEIERIQAVNPVHPNGRAFNIGLGLQRCTKFVAPQAGNKGSEYGGSRAGLDLRSKIVEVSVLTMSWARAGALQAVSAMHSWLPLLCR